MSFLEELESLRIPLPDIEEATENFTTLIGKGGYGLVYKGQLSLSGKLTTVAVKRLDGSNISGQGFKEFLTEIQLLTRYKHPNLISLIGFCDQDSEKILVYEHAEHGSLDKYISTAENRSKLTWKRRINICVNAARGLNFLHNEVASNERVIHRDIKSANVLLDQNWKAMISDLGLSKLGRANEKDTFLITNASGTPGYCDPAYISSGILTKESDVYSFGVVLFEVLCGRLCFINVNSEHRFLHSLAQRYYKMGKIDEIMDPALKNQIDLDSLNKFSKIASQCLQNNRKRRPSMRTVVKKLEELEKALEVQELKEALEIQQRQDANQLLDKTQAEMHGAMQTRDEPPNGTPQLKRSSDDMQNNSSISSLVKTKKRVHDVHTSDSMQRESVSKADNVAAVRTYTGLQENIIRGMQFQSMLPPTPSAHMSATTLLQKAAQMGSTRSNNHAPSAHMSATTQLQRAAQIGSTTSYNHGDTNAFGLMSLTRDFLGVGRNDRKKIV